MTTEEGNKILRTFLGIDTLEEITLKLYTDWGVLMRVIDKVESLDGGHHGNFIVHISSNSCNIQGTNLHKCLEPDSNYPPVYMSDPNAIFSTKIESAWYNLIKFIQWYDTDYKKTDI